MATGAVEAVWRIEAGRLVARLSRLVGDPLFAEDLAQEALVAALEQWPDGGAPANPGGWLFAVARRRWVDTVRRDVTYRAKLAEIARDQAEHVDPIGELGVDTTVSDDVLRLMFTACHPVLRPESRGALALRMVAGLTTEEIARAYLVPVPTMAQRITRAKAALRAAGVPFELPVGDELLARLGSVLEVVYLLFNEGYTATGGETWTRPALCEEATRLARMLVALTPDEPEVLALDALLEIQASRLRARTGPGGTPIPLLEQNRARWDRLLITRALGLLDRARAELARRGQPAGSYLLQAEIAACHARAVTADGTDWSRMADLYAALAALTGSPVVELNRAVAVGMAEGPAAGLAVLDALGEAPELRGYHLFAAVRGDLLIRLGRADEARHEFARAAEMTANQAERELLLRRAGTS